MEKTGYYILLVLTLLNSGLVFIALSRLNGLRKDLRTPVVKKFNPDYPNRRKSVEIPKAPDNAKKDFRPQNRNNQQQASVQNRPKNSASQNRPVQLRRSAAKSPDVFSNDVSEAQAPNPVPPRSVAAESASAEGRRPLPPRFATQEQAAHISFNAPAELATNASKPASVAQAISEDNDSGIELDRSKMTHGRRNVVKKSVIDDDDNVAEGKSV